LQKTQSVLNDDLALLQALKMRFLHDKTLQREGLMRNKTGKK
jgi:hypothetical protein